MPAIHRVGTPSVRHAAPAPARKRASRANQLNAPRQARSLGTLALGGRSIARLARAPTAPTRLSQQAVNFFFDSTLTPLGKSAQAADLLGLPVKSINWRTAAYARTAVAAPLVPGGAKDPFGKLTIMRPGLGNIGFSPASVFRAAQYSDKLVVAYTGLGSGAQRTLRPATEIEGVPVPPSLKGKIFVIGDPDHNLINYLQSSDVLLEQLEAMRKAGPRYGIDPLHSKATFVGHSQGGLDGTLTRKRLEAAGYSDAIGRLVAVGSPFRGSNCADQLLGLASGALAASLDRDDGFRAIKQLDPEPTRKWFGKAEEQLVDLSYSGCISGTPELRTRLGIPPLELEDPNNIRPMLRLAAHGASLSDVTKGASALIGFLMHEPRPGDGLVPLASATYGKERIPLKMPYDHIGMIEDFHVIDQIAADVVARP
ncbi:MAG: hypothetical protein QM765_17380 [Myxococcales bacterium]